jgi:phage I-like protein
MSPGDFERVQQGNKASGAWGFYLRRKDGWTRLLARGSGGPVGRLMFDVPHFVMEQKMMRGIRDRAEQSRRDQVHAFVEHKYQGEATNTSSLVK